MAPPVPYLAAGNNATSGSAGLNATVSHNVAAGDCIAVWVTTNNNNMATTPVSDTQSNTYAQAGTNVLNGTVAGAWWVCQNAKALASGTDVITFTCTGTGGAKTISAIGCPGVKSSGAVDKTPTPTTGTSTAPSISSGALSQANELCLAGEHNVNGGGAISWSAPFTGIDSEHPGTSQFGAAATDVVSSTSSVTATGTITSAAWGMGMVTLEFTTPTITTGSFPTGTTGSSYTAQETESGGTAPFAWTKASGSFPPGLNMNSAGLISGTPTQSGTFNFTVTVTDHFGFSATSGTQTIVIAALGLNEDISTPTPTHQAMGTTGSCASNSFSPPANSLVVVCFAWMFKGTGSFPGAINVTDNHGNTYLQGAEQDNTQESTTGIWIFFYSSAPGATTVTVTNTNHGQASVLLAPRVLNGASSSQAGGGATTDNDDASMHITTTQTGSLVYCVGAAPVIKKTPTTDVTLMTEDLFQDNGPGQTGNQGVVGRLINATGVPGKTWTGWTSGLSQGCGLEILPSPAVFLGTAGHPGPTWQTGQVLGSNDVNTWILPLAQQKTAATGRQTASTPVQTADPDLQIPLITAGTWAIRAVIFTDGANAADMQYSFSMPAGATMFYQADYINTSGNPISEAHQGTDSVTVDTTGAGTLGAVIIDGLISVAGQTGTVSFNWAQGAANNSTPTNIDQNSYLMAWRLG